MLLPPGAENPGYATSRLRGTRSSIWTVVGDKKWSLCGSPRTIAVVLSLLCGKYVSNDAALSHRCRCHDDIYQKARLPTHCLYCMHAAANRRSEKLSVVRRSFFSLCPFPSAFNSVLVLLCALRRVISDSLVCLLVRGTCKSVNNCTILIARTVGAIYFCTVYAIFGQNRACNVV